MSSASIDKLYSRFFQGRQIARHPVIDLLIIRMSPNYLSKISEDSLEYRCFSRLPSIEAAQIQALHASLLSMPLFDAFDEVFQTNSKDSNSIFEFDSSKLSELLLLRKTNSVLGDHYVASIFFYWLEFILNSRKNINLLTINSLELFVCEVDTFGDLLPPFSTIESYLFTHFISNYLFISTNSILKSKSMFKFDSDSTEIIISHILRDETLDSEFSPIFLGFTQKVSENKAIDPNPLLDCINNVVCGKKKSIDKKDFQKLSVVLVPFIDSLNIKAIQIVSNLSTLIMTSADVDKEDPTNSHNLNAVSLKDCFILLPSLLLRKIKKGNPFYSSNDLPKIPDKCIYQIINYNKSKGDSENLDSNINIDKIEIIDEFETEVNGVKKLILISDDQFKLENGFKPIKMKPSISLKELIPSDYSDFLLSFANALVKANSLCIDNFFMAVNKLISALTEDPYYIDFFVISIFLATVCIEKVSLMSLIDMFNNKIIFFPQYTIFDFKKLVDSNNNKINQNNHNKNNTNKNGIVNNEHDNNKSENNESENNEPENNEPENNEPENNESENIKIENIIKECNDEMFKNEDGNVALLFFDRIRSIRFHVFNLFANQMDELIPDFLRDATNYPFLFAEEITHISSTNQINFEVFMTKEFLLSIFTVIKRLINDYFNNLELKESENKQISLVNNDDIFLALQTVLHFLFQLLKNSRIESQYFNSYFFVSSFFRLYFVDFLKPFILMTVRNFLIKVEPDSRCLVPISLYFSKLFKELKYFKDKKIITSITNNCLISALSINLKIAPSFSNTLDSLLELEPFPELLPLALNFLSLVTQKSTNKILSSKHLKSIVDLIKGIENKIICDSEEEKEFNASIKLSLMNLCASSTSLGVKSLFLIRKPSMIPLLFIVFGDKSREELLSVLDLFSNLCDFSASNCVACHESGIDTILLEFVLNCVSKISNIVEFRSVQFKLNFKKEDIFSTIFPFITKIISHTSNSANSQLFVKLILSCLKDHKNQKTIQKGRNKTESEIIVASDDIEKLDFSTKIAELLLDQLIISRTQVSPFFPLGIEISPFKLTDIKFQNQNSFSAGNAFSMINKSFTFVTWIKVDRLLSLQTSKSIPIIVIEDNKENKESAPQINESITINNESENIENLQENDSADKNNDDNDTNNKGDGNVNNINNSSNNNNNPSNNNNNSNNIFNNNNDKNVFSLFLNRGNLYYQFNDYSEKICEQIRSNEWFFIGFVCQRSSQENSCIGLFTDMNMGYFSDVPPLFFPPPQEASENTNSLKITFGGSSPLVSSSYATTSYNSNFSYNKCPSALLGPFGFCNKVLNEEILESIEKRGPEIFDEKIDSNSENNFFVIKTSKIYGKLDISNDIKASVETKHTINYTNFTKSFSYQFCNNDLNLVSLMDIFVHFNRFQQITDYKDNKNNNENNDSSNKMKLLFLILSIMKKVFEISDESQKNFTYFGVIKNYLLKYAKEKATYHLYLAFYSILEVLKDKETMQSLFDNLLVNIELYSRGPPKHFEMIVHHWGHSLLNLFPFLFKRNNYFNRLCKMYVYLFNKKEFDDRYYEDECIIKKIRLNFSNLLEGASKLGLTKDNIDYFENFINVQTDNEDNLYAFLSILSSNIDKIKASNDRRSENDYSLTLHHFAENENEDISELAILSIHELCKPNWMKPMVALAIQINGKIKSLSSVSASSAATQLAPAKKSKQKVSLLDSLTMNSPFSAQQKPIIQQTLRNQNSLSSIAYAKLQRIIDFLLQNVAQYPGLIYLITSLTTSFDNDAERGKIAEKLKEIILISNNAHMKEGIKELVKDKFWFVWILIVAIQSKGQTQLSFLTLISFLLSHSDDLSKEMNLIVNVLQILESVDKSFDYYQIALDLFVNINAMAMTNSKHLIMPCVRALFFKFNDVYFSKEISQIFINSSITNANQSSLSKSPTRLNNYNMNNSNDTKGNLKNNKYIKLDLFDRNEIMNVLSVFVDTSSVNDLLSLEPLLVKDFTDYCLNFGLSCDVGNSKTEGKMGNFLIQILENNKNEQPNNHQNSFPPIENDNSAGIKSENNTESNISINAILGLDVFKGSLQQVLVDFILYLMEKEERRTDNKNIDFMNNFASKFTKIRKYFNKHYLSAIVDNINQIRSTIKEIKTLVFIDFDSVKQSSIEFIKKSDFISQFAKNVTKIDAQRFASYFIKYAKAPLAISSTNDDDTDIKESNNNVNESEIDSKNNDSVKNSYQEQCRHNCLYFCPMKMQLRVSEAINVLDIVKFASVKGGYKVKWFEFGVEKENVDFLLNDEFFSLYEKNQFVISVLLSKVEFALPRGKNSLEFFTKRVGTFYLEFFTVDYITVTSQLNKIDGQKFIFDQDQKLLMNILSPQRKSAFQTTKLNDKNEINAISNSNNINNSNSSGNTNNIDSNNSYLRRGEISNFGYMMLLNFFSGFSFHREGKVPRIPIDDKMYSATRFFLPEVHTKDDNIFGIYERRHILEKMSDDQLFIAGKKKFRNFQPKPKLFFNNAVNSSVITSLTVRDLKLDKGAIVFADFLKENTNIFFIITKENEVHFIEILKNKLLLLNTLSNAQNQVVEQQQTAATTEENQSINDLKVDDKTKNRRRSRPELQFINRIFVSLKNSVIISTNYSFLAITGKKCQKFTTRRVTPVLNGIFGPFEVKPNMPKSLSEYKADKLVSFLSDGKTIVFVSNECEVRKSDIFQQQQSNSIDLICSSSSKITCLATSQSFDAVAYGNENCQVVVNSLSVDKRVVNSVINIKNLEPQKIVITKSWGLIVIEAQKNLFVFTINGTFVGRTDIENELTILSHATNRFGGDFIIFVDRSNRIGIFEAVKPTKIKYINCSQSSDIVSLKYLSAFECIAALDKKEGILTFYPMKINEF